MNVDEQAQIQLLALSLKELIQSSAMTALDQLFVFLAVIMRSLSQSPAHSARRSHRRWCVGPKQETCLGSWTGMHNFSTWTSPAASDGM